MPWPARRRCARTAVNSWITLFSGCCGVYARVDLPPESFESDLQQRGTTNVDFNDPMRAALNRLRDREEVRLSVGRDEVALSARGPPRNRDRRLS